VSDPAKIAVLVALLLLAYAAMRAGWRRRTARAAGAVPELPVVPPLGTPRLGPVEVTYLSTAVADDRLARVAAHGLAVRAAAEVEVHADGVLVRRRGSSDLFCPASSIQAVTRASGMAGTAVGADRVVVIRWTIGGTCLDTGLLPRHPADTDGLVEALLAVMDRPAQDTPPAAATTDGSHA
jgi:hypothetical protein